MAEAETIRNEGAWSRDPQSRLLRDQDTLSPGAAGWGEPGGTTGIVPPAAEASMYLLMILVLLLRPRGLLGERIERFE